jgi:hypothetical protein
MRSLDICFLQSAHIGGESILCSVFTVHNYLQVHAPEALDELRQDFWWEYRGFSDKFFRAPILSYNSKGEPLIRYLRDYMESAYARQGLALTDKQVCTAPAAVRRFAHWPRAKHPEEL